MYTAMARVSFSVGSLSAGFGCLQTQPAMLPKPRRARHAWSKAWLSLRSVAHAHKVSKEGHLPPANSERF
jgi:hypothetical protein